jgi:hypothetical protein
MEIVNYFDLKFILNVSISISISLFLVFIFGKAVGDTLSEITKFFLKNIGKSFLKQIAPVKFAVGFPLDRNSPDQFTYEKHKVINFGKLSQTNLPATGIDILITSSAKLPFLYEGSTIRIQLIDVEDMLGIYSAEKLPSKPSTFILAKMMYENNIANHIHIDLKPKKTFKNYKVPIVVYFQGRPYKNEISLTVVVDD